MPALTVEFSDRELEGLRQIARERGTSTKALVREAAAADTARHPALQEGAEAFWSFSASHADEFAEAFPDDLCERRGTLPVVPVWQRSLRKRDQPGSGPSASVLVAVGAEVGALAQEARMRRASWEGEPGSADQTTSCWSVSVVVARASQSRVSSPTTGCLCVFVPTPPTTSRAG